MKVFLSPYVLVHQDRNLKCYTLLYTTLLNASIRIICFVGAQDT